MTGGAPILCPGPCDIGMLEDYHPAEERDSVFPTDGYVGHCTAGCGSFYVPPPRPVSEVPDAQEMNLVVEEPSLDTLLDELQQASQALRDRLHEEGVDDEALNTAFNQIDSWASSVRTAMFVKGQTEQERFNE